ncbi:cytochrome P450 [Xylariomycetidae sp. FL0641]|nr:cytochrome P450 [Xylariomycetidae sp. FL0641]
MATAGRLLTLFVVYRITIALYNISPFHPLSKFPGPKLACMSYAYETYYDYWLHGRYTRRIQQMHEKYGPIVRINPDELHCTDPGMRDDIYASGNRIRDKSQHFLNMMPGATSVGSFATGPHELHRARRGAKARYFSRAQMLKLEDEVRDYTDRTIAKMLRCAGKGQFDLKQVFNCYTADIISHYTFGEPMGFTTMEGFEPNFATWVHSFTENTYLLRNIPGARALTSMTPHIAKYVNPSMRSFVEQLEVHIPRYIKNALAEKEHGRLFSDLLDSPLLSDEDKSMYRLTGEGFTVLAAGTETTAAALSCISYYLLANPGLLAQLQGSLQGVDPMNPKWTELEQRPLLWAIIHEALRHYPGLSHRLPRMAREEELVYDRGDYHYVIPKNTPIGMSPILHNHNPELFPDPLAFRPERWLLPNGRHNYAMEKQLLSFGSGSRVCIGLNLAYCEMYLMTAAMALRLFPRARLVDTTAEDVVYDHDANVPQTVKGSIAVRIEVD